MVRYTLWLHAGEVWVLWLSLLNNYRFYGISKKFIKYRFFKKNLKAISIFLSLPPLLNIVRYTLWLHSVEVCVLWPSLLSNYRFYSISKKIQKYWLFKKNLKVISNFYAFNHYLIWLDTLFATCWRSLSTLADFVKKL